MIVDTTQLDRSEEIVFLEERRVAPVLVEFPGDRLTTEQLRALESCPISRQTCNHLRTISDPDERSVYMLSTCNTGEHSKCPGALGLYVELYGGQN
jgi:hypothetical protein